MSLSPKSIKIQFRMLGLSDIQDNTKRAAMIENDLEAYEDKKKECMEAEARAEAKAKLDKEISDARAKEDAEEDALHRARDKAAREAERRAAAATRRAYAAAREAKKAAQYAAIVAAIKKDIEARRAQEEKAAAAARIVEAHRQEVFRANMRKLEKAFMTTEASKAEVEQAAAAAKKAEEEAKQADERRQLELKVMFEQCQKFVDAQMEKQKKVAHVMDWRDYLEVPVYKVEPCGLGPIFSYIFGDILEKQDREEEKNEETQKEEGDEQPFESNRV